MNQRAVSNMWEKIRLAASCAAMPMEQFKQEIRRMIMFCWVGYLENGLRCRAIILRCGFDRSNGVPRSLVEVAQALQTEGWGAYSTFRLCSLCLPSGPLYCQGIEVRQSERPAAQPVENLPLNDDGRVPIEYLDFSIRTYNCLKKARVNFLDELRLWTDYDLLEIRNFGQRSLDEVREKCSDPDLDHILLEPVEWPYAVSFQLNDVTDVIRSSVMLDTRPEPELTMDELNWRQSAQRLFMRNLDEHQRDIMTRRFGLDGSPRQTRGMVAQQCEVTWERVAMVESRMLGILRRTTPRG